jgi:uncharacterized protein YjgD (DUF1641 family)
VITITLTQDELSALAGIMDAGVKTLGLASVKQAASLLTKLEAAVAAANAKPSEPQETE